jgi:hypothetical protein
MSHDPFAGMDREVGRWRDQHGPDYPEAMIKLIDAMRDFIRADETIGRELLQEGVITRDQFARGMAENAPLVAWLKKYEQHGIDPTLYGIIKG